MQEYYASEYLRKLDQLSIPYFLQKRLEERYQSPEARIRERFEEIATEYEDRIAYFAKTVLKNRCTPQEVATPTTQESDFSAIAEEAAIYFQQGREMLQTSLDMPENSSPLVEYYGFLQCAKGMILLELNVNQKLLFSHHGLAFAKTNSRYISATIKERGVFSALLLRRGGVIFKKYEEAIEVFFSQLYSRSLEEVVTDRHKQGDPVYAFMGSWMLSSLVRYRPLKWEEIQGGKKDDIISSIREYRKQELSQALENLLREYSPSPPTVRI